MNDAYTDYAKNYPDYEEDKLRIQEWGNIFVRFYSESVRTFMRKRTQLYTIFCLIDYIERKNIQVTDEIISRFNHFVQLYTEFENSSGLIQSDDDDNVIQQYKLASSEGVNKIRNRRIRFEILRDFVLS